MSEEPTETEIENEMHERAENFISEMLLSTADTPFSTREIAEGIFEAEKLVEGSYDKETSRYLISTSDAVEMVFNKKGIPQIARIVYLAYSAWSNDTAEWAERVLGKEREG